MWHTGTLVKNEGCNTYWLNSKNLNGNVCFISQSRTQDLHFSYDCWEWDLWKIPAFGEQAEVVCLNRSFRLFFLTHFRDFLFPFSSFPFCLNRNKEDVVGLYEGCKPTEMVPVQFCWGLEARNSCALRLGLLLCGLGEVIQALLASVSLL